MGSLVRGALGALLACGTLGVGTSAARANPPDIGAALETEVAFSFPEGDEALPLPVPAERIVTVAVERRGDQLRGVILLTDGGLIHFDGARSRPLAAPPADAFAAADR